MAIEARRPSWLARRASALRVSYLAGVGRIKATALPIAQCSIGAGLAWFIARHLVGHVSPFFAPIAAVISLGVSLGSRWRRSVELVCGVVLGIALADLLVSLLGRGGWQLCLLVAIAMIAATFLDKGLIFPMQAASSAILVALLPPSLAGPNRIVDALTGGVIGILISALLPAHPLLRTYQAASELLTTAETVLREVAAGLVAGDVPRVQTALALARGSQPQVDALQAYVRTGHEIVRISPLFWTYRNRAQRLVASADHIDRVIRDLRVLARRALILITDQEAIDPKTVEAMEATAAAVAHVRALWTAKTPSQEAATQVESELRACAAKLRPELLVGATLNADVVFAQLESAVFDLFHVAGFDTATALSALPLGHAESAD